MQKKALLVYTTRAIEFGGDRILSRMSGTPGLIRYHLRWWACSDHIGMGAVIKIRD